MKEKDQFQPFKLAPRSILLELTEEQKSHLAEHFAYAKLMADKTSYDVEHRVMILGQFWSPEDSHQDRGKVRVGIVPTEVAEKIKGIPRN